MQFIVGFGIVDNIRDWSISSLKEGDKREGGGGRGGWKSAIAIFLHHESMHFKPFRQINAAS